MAATTVGPFNSTSFRISLGTGASNAMEVLSREKEVKLTFGSDKIDITSKDSVGWAEFLGGLKNWSGSGSGFVDFEPGSGKFNVEKLLAEFLSGDRLVSAKFTTAATGDVIITGTIFLDNIEITATMESGCELSFSFTGSGAPTVGDVPA